jgi:site-specific DNA-methyltransferase (adenine-specific)
MAYQLHQQDCVEWMAAQPAESVDCVLTSPPYDNIRNYNGYSFDFESTAQQLVRLLAPGGVIVWNVADATQAGSESGTSMRQALYFMSLGLRLHDTMIYVKRNPMPTNRATRRYHQAWEYLFVFSKHTPRVFNPIQVAAKYSGDAMMKYRGQDGALTYKKTPRNAQTKLRNVFEYTIGGGHTTKNKQLSQHPALMPEQLALDQLSTWADSSSRIYDPFAGAGTTMWAAQQLGFDSVGTEIDSEYCALIHHRMTHA